MPIAQSINVHIATDRNTAKSATVPRTWQCSSHLITHCSTSGLSLNRNKRNQNGRQSEPLAFSNMWSLTLNKINLFISLSDGTNKAPALTMTSPYNNNNNNNNNNNTNNNNSWFVIILGVTLLFVRYVVWFIVSICVSQMQINSLTYSLT